VKFPEALISLLDDPISTLKRPGCTSQLWTEVFQIDISRVLTINSTVFFSPGAKSIFLNPLRSLGGSSAYYGKPR